MADIFVSYAHSDAGRARTIATALETKGWSVWWDPELAAGQSFVRVINTEIAVAGCVVVLWSKTSVMSRWVMEEAHYGLMKDILCPVLIDHGPQLPVGFATLKYLDFGEWDGDELTVNLDPLFKQVQLLVGRPTVTHAPASISNTSRQVTDVANATSELKPNVAPPSTPKQEVRSPDVAVQQNQTPAAEPQRRSIASTHGFIDFSDFSWIDFPIAILLWSATLLVIADIIMRYVFSAPLTFSELMPLMFSCAAFFGGAISIRNGRETKGPIGILFKRFIQGFAAPLNQVVSAVLFGLVAFLLLPLTQKSYQMQETTTGIAQLSLWPWKSLVVVAFAAMAIGSIIALLRGIRRKHVN